MFAPTMNSDEVNSEGDTATGHVLQGVSNLVSPVTGSSETCNMGIRNRWESHLPEDLLTAQSVSINKHVKNNTIL